MSQQKYSTSSRERFLKSIHHEIPDRIPLSFNNGFSPGFQRKVEKLGYQKDLFELFHADSRMVMPALVKRGSYKKYYPEYDPETFSIGIFGTARKKGSEEHFTKLISPLTKVTTKHDILNYPFPYCDYEACLKQIRKKVEFYHQQGYAVIGHSGHLFETAWQIRGMEEFLMDFYLHPDWAEVLLDRLVNLKQNVVSALVKGGVDLLHFGDDVGTQKGMMMAPNIWRTFLKERLKKLIDIAYQINPDIAISYHSDGNIYEIIPDLIEIGVTILNPVQPECMDLGWIKKEYGRFLTLWGTIGIQRLLPFGTPKEIKDEIKYRIEELGYNGGLILGPTHMVEPEVPFENVKTMVDTIIENKLQ